MISPREKLEKVVNILSFFALDDSSKEVRHSAIYALGYRYSIERKYRRFIVSILARTAEDADASLRLASTHALSNVGDKKIIPVVEKLLRDQDKHVRDWTAFYIKNSTYSGFDSEEIRNALVTMLDDEYDDARSEAVCSLAFLRDRRALAALHQELDVNEYTIKNIMAEAAADLGDASLLPNLEVWDERFPGDRHIRTQLRRLQIKVGQAKRNQRSKGQSPAVWLPSERCAVFPRTPLLNSSEKIPA
jgi:HEAT repeat protein